MRIEPGRTYLLRNNKSGRYVSSRAFSEDEAKTLQQLDLRTETTQRDAQTWHVMPVDDDYVFVVNKKSSKVVSPQAFSPNEATTLQQLDLRAETTRRDAQTWLIIEDGGSLRLFRNRHSGRYLSPQGFWTDEAVTLQQLNLRNESSSRRGQQWEMVVAGEDKRVTELKPVDREVHDIGDVHRLTGYQMPPELTEEVLVGQTVVPYILVDDGDRSWQSQNNPYYILRRYGHWKRVFYYEHAGNSEYTEKQATTVGLTTSNSSTIERTVGMTVGADAGFSFKGVSASISTTVTTGLRVAHTQSSENHHSESREVSRSYFANGKKVAEAVWFRGDRYSLQRLDGSQLLEWRTVDDRTIVNDAYPATALTRDTDEAEPDAERRLGELEEDVLLARHLLERVDQLLGDLLLRPRPNPVHRGDQ
ncbi:RICIN domain-containing protein [Nocardia sp. NPDC005745]|uniref:RICIN domain-containing protein n=1 Tax=Nocardia sp. NPDC005745 TaxID=3157061 RepID=UPI0033E9F8F4